MPSQNLNSHAIHREQIESIFKQLPILLWIDVISGSAFFLFAMIVRQNPNSLIYLWYGALLGISALSCAALVHYKKLPEATASPQRKEQLLLLIVVLSGFVWGTTWLVAPFSTDLLIVAPKGASLAWPVAMLASAAINLSVSRKLFFSFAIPVLFFQVAFHIYQGSARDFLIASGIASIFAFTSFLAMRFNVDLNQSIKLKLRNKSLDKQLREDEIILAQREMELVNRVEREKRLLIEKRAADRKLAMAAKEKLPLLDAISEGIFGINEFGDITFVNAMAMTLLNLEEKEVLGQNALAIICRSKISTVQEDEIRKSIESCLQNGISEQHVKSVFCGKGEFTIPVTFSCRPITEEQETIGAVVSFSDISKQLEMEAKLLQSQKMEAIGRITGGVAHDFNNLLTVVMGNLQFLKRQLVIGGRTDDSDLVDKIMTAAKRGSELNKRLLGFSRERALESAPENLNRILVGMHNFLKRALGEEIRIDLNLAETESIVMIDRAQFENVIVNICLNARDAMPKGGTVILTTQYIRRTDPDALSSPDLAEPREIIELAITDSGEGIPQDIQDKIFEPFFTTKPIGEGSGFGLSTAYDFMQQSAGSITVKGQPGEGTTFTLRIPVMDESILTEQEEAPSLSSYAKYHGTILLVEDDDGVRDVATHMLTEAGFEVIAANNANAGLEEFDKNPTIDLVFSDIIMPGGMNGVEMAERIQKSKPGVPILLATGYTDKHLKDRIRESSKLVCISKPYDIDRLPDVIHSMMNQLEQQN